MVARFNKKVYTIKEFFEIMDKSGKSIKYFFKSKRDGILTRQFEERINLAVTEVNGCQACSYGHAKIALKYGISREEINLILNGTTSRIPEYETAAIFFAQHYAETKGRPDQKTWNRIMSIYGTKKATAILATIRMMMFGNSYGIAFSALKNRIIGKPVSNSRLVNEVGVILSGIFFITFIISGLFYNSPPEI